MDRLPTVTPELIDYLKRLFPDRAPEPEWSEREIWMMVGAARVVRHLNQLYEEQIENALGI